LKIGFEKEESVGKANIAIDIFRVGWYVNKVLQKGSRNCLQQKNIETYKPSHEGCHPRKGEMSSWLFF
jgi:hypothetical protein